MKAFKITIYKHSLPSQWIVLIYQTKIHLCALDSDVAESGFR